MTAAAELIDELHAQVAALTAQVERLQATATAADLASREIDVTVQSLEPQINNMQEAAAALTTLVNLTGGIQHGLVRALRQLEPGDFTPAPLPDPAPGEAPVAE